MNDQNQHFSGIRLTQERISQYQKRILKVFLFVLLSLFITTEPPLYADTCLGCHKSIEPVVDLSLLKKSVHAPLKCTDCHQTIESDHYSGSTSKVNCGSCHTEIADHLAQSAHQEGKHSQISDVPRCTHCHGTHGILPKSDPTSPIYHMNVPELCSQCHTNEKITHKHPIPTPEFIQNYRQSVHGKGITESGLIVSAVCTDCHTAHEVKAKTNVQSSIFHTQVPLTCGKCHVGILSDFEKSAHGKMWKEENLKGPVCTTCHTSHQISDPRSDRFKLDIPHKCGTCHVDKAPTYGDTFHGKATSFGYVVAAGCADCHTPHLNLSKNDPLSTIHKSNLTKTCGKCHSSINEKFISYDPHLNANDKSQSPIVYYFHRFMLLLLIGVFGFFGLHTLLWLQRSIVGAIRKEFTRYWNKDTYIKRFSSTHRLTHLFVIISFLGLALTGIPLKYHEAHWAHVMNILLGGIEVTRFIHRFCAIITFGYFMFHIGYIFYKKFDLLSPDSLIPRKKDLIDFYHNIRWFLYLGERPHIGRWSYWEKFDYFAVFWGVPVIGLSGLILWFPEFFTHFLPGYLINIAMVVHSEEALLAVSFIFTIHFFHTHLKPESFPIDTVIFTGKMPLDRFIEERPEEYENLKNSGKLEQLLTKPPTAFEERLARWIGFTALVLGLITALFIYITLFFQCTDKVNQLL